MKHRWMRLTAVVIVTAVLLSAGGIGAYTFVAQPKYYALFTETGAAYLEAEDYEQAALAYTKAIAMDQKSAEARLGAGRSYVGGGKIEEAVQMLRQAQDLDGQNITLLREVIELLKDVAPDQAYDVLQRYVERVGEGDIAPAMADMIQSSNEPPVMPLIAPAGQSYVTAVQVTLSTDKLRVGHSIHYTLDGSDPTADSPTYQGVFPITEESVLKAVSISATGARSDCAQAKFAFDKTALPALRVLYESARKEVDGVTVGVAVGNCVDGAKEETEPLFQQTKQVLEKVDEENVCTLQELETAHQQLEAGLERFRLKIIQPCDKAALGEAIFEANAIYSASTEGTADGQYKTGARAALNTVITEAQQRYDDILTRQAQADGAVGALAAALKIFDSNMIKLVVNPDGTNFTYAFKSLMGESTSISYTGRFKVVKNGTVQLESGEKDIYAGDFGDISLEFTRSGNAVTVNGRETWPDGSYIYTQGTWYAEYDGETHRFRLSPEGVDGTALSGYEGYFVDGTMTGERYYEGVGRALDFTAS